MAVHIQAAEGERAAAKEAAERLQRASEEAGEKPAADDAHEQPTEEGRMAMQAMHVPHAPGKATPSFTRAREMFLKPSARLRWDCGITMTLCAGGEIASQEHRPMGGVLGGASDLGEPSGKGRAPVLTDASQWKAAPVEERSRHTHEVPFRTT